MTTSESQPARPSLGRGWRYVVVAALLLAAASIFVNVLLWSKASDAISGNRAIACGLARLGGAAPARRLPGQKASDFHRSLRAFKRLLRDAHTAGCNLPKPVKGSALDQNRKGVVPGSGGSNPGGLSGPPNGGSGNGGSSPPTSGPPPAQPSPIVHVPGVTGPGQTCVTTFGSTIACRLRR